MYEYSKPSASHSHAYLLPPVLQVLQNAPQTRLFDLGCGNGSVANVLHRAGFEVTGVDDSVSGIAVANKHFPELNLHVGSAYDDLAARFGRFPFVVSLEVVEQLYAPRAFAKTVFDLLEPDGLAIISTPYHGYIKNLVLALSGKMDAHFTALWDGGHIKFWSERTMRELLTEAGFVDINFKRVGRINALAKSMIAFARRPASIGVK